MAENRLRVLQIVAGLDIGGAHGGAERFGVELSKHLDHNLFDVSVCAFWKRGGRAEAHWSKVLQDRGINFFFAAEWTGKFDLLKYFSGVRQIAEHCIPPVDIIHSHFQMGTVAAITLKLLGRARFAIRTAHITLEWGEGLTASICRQVCQNWLFPLFLDAEVGVSQAIVDRLRHHLGTRLVGRHPHLIHNAIHLDAFQNDGDAFERISLPFGEDELIIGSIGRFTKQKGYIYLIEALPRVLSELPNVRLVLVGDGELYNDLVRRAQELNVGGWILFAGQREDVVPLIKSMDVFVLPSLWEGLPTVVLESMACGVPIIATDVPGTRELVQHRVTGWLVPPGNAEELANAIVQLLRSPSTRTELATRARRLVNTFSISAIADKYMVLYHDITKTTIDPEKTVNTSSKNGESRLDQLNNGRASH